MDLVEDARTFVRLPIGYNEDPRAFIMPVNYSPEELHYLEQLQFAYDNKLSSPEVLELTTMVLKFNPNNYKAFTMRRIVLFASENPDWLFAELEYSWVSLGGDCKNYQHWHHRMLLIQELLSQNLFFSFETEFEEISGLLEEDAKNFHLWEYRIWVCKLFLNSKDKESAIAFLERELEFSERLLRMDVLNNSFWSYRAFISKSIGLSARTEFELYVELIKKAPNSEPGWNFLSALFLAADDVLKTDIYTFALDYCTGEAVIRAPALFFCCDFSWFRPAARPELQHNCMLASQFDLPHRNYWGWVAEHLADFCEE